MNKQELKHLFEPNSDCTKLINRIGNQLPQDVPFTILQINPDGELEIRSPIERPEFNSTKLRSGIEKDNTMRHAYEILIDHLEASILLEISTEGDLNKLSILSE